MTDMTFQWIYHNKHHIEFSQAKDVDDLKRMVMKKMEPIDDSFIRGAKLVKWDVVYKVVKSDSLL